MKGKAVVFDDRLKVQVREVELPEPGPQDVVIDVKVSWISNGTESSFLRGERLGGDTPYVTGAAWPFPIVAGYQKTGRVRSVGAEVTDFSPGDHVFATLSKVNGMFDPMAGHVSPAITPADQVWKLPEGADGTAFSGTVLAQVGYNCGMRPAVSPGNCAIVLGDGMVGHWTAQTLLHRQADVLVAGKHDYRLQMLASGLKGKNITVSPLRTAATEFLKGRGVAIIVDTVGDLGAVDELLPLLERNSYFVSAGFYGRAGSFDIQKLRNQEITLQAPSGWTRGRINETIAGIHDGWLNTQSLVTHRFPVDQAADAWRLIADRTEPHLGVVLDW
ncbi:oxidoreductase zinc-binding dehydrogenase family [Paenibacillus agaridevorans]|uniref:Oxidoreductase zinc-binding dehydrogenase family n=1 Tax=Paenibacillus agaridevorans TaxID=171404 RepID=A0A2R5EVN5_9BACL|nr:hypothetical protein [Paenibacillus agaridevorans]GBG10185.1 oxidoreductase zinc-binding dehydrogenase family [Paenibacillus agaridevorans]